MITHVAVRDDQGVIWSLPRPNRHGHVIQMFARQGRTVDKKRKHGKENQGFLTHSGAFLSRREAFDHALACGQLLPPYDPADPSKRRGEINLRPREIFSEDLW